jgi:tetratricopeptide (TPR) repeat protein
MRLILKRYNFITYILIAQLLSLPSPALAQATGTQAGRNLKVVVLEVSDGTLQPQEVEKVTDTVRDELQTQSKFTIVPKQQTRQFFTNNPTVMQRIDVANPLNRYLDEAKEFYKNFQFKEAIGLLSNVIDTYRRANPPMTESFLLVDSYLYLGNVYMGNNDKKNANNVFMEAVRLDPQREITEEKYPPKVVRKFGEAKTEYLSKAKTAQLDIFTNPRGAEIYVNGVHLGQAPIKVDRFTQGEHFILAKQDGLNQGPESVDTNYSRIKLVGRTNKSPKLQD